MADSPARPAPLESITVGDIKVTYLPDGYGVGTAHALFPAGDEAFGRPIRTCSTKRAGSCSPSADS